MESTVYNQKGTEAGKFNAPLNIFGLPWNADLVQQVATSLMSSKRKNIAHAKDRSEVRGGGKKPWKQKGTGRARHGSTRSPIWVGGGVAHGPRNEKNFDRKVSKKMRAKALFTILSKKYKDGEILFIDSVSLSAPKTKVAVQTLENLSGVKGFASILKKRNNSAVFALSSKNTETEKSFANLGNIEVLEARNLHPLALLQYKYLVIENPSEAIKLFPGQKLLKSKDGADKAVKEKKAKKPVAKKAVKTKTK